jgi:hypothetical protein
VSLLIKTGFGLTVNVFSNLTAASIYLSGSTLEWN